MAEVETSREGAVLTITLNRPDVLNAMNGALHAGLRAALDEARDPAVRAVVLTGAGKGFCVGQDLQELQRTAPHLGDRLRESSGMSLGGLPWVDVALPEDVHGACSHQKKGDP
jgi:2-(1,2-epoxy-1,2-dihydrophenyl)acetyl-CoA isomerase